MASSVVDATSYAGPLWKPVSTVGHPPGLIEYKLFCTHPCPDQGGNMKILRLMAVAALALLAACSFRMDPDKHAHKFFDEGRDMILSSLKKQDLPEAQIKGARAVLDRHEAAITGEIAGVFRQQRSLFRGITSGQGSEQLVQLESALHKSNEQAVRSIGRMHEELATTVGEPAWKAATADMSRRMARHFDDSTK